MPPDQVGGSRDPCSERTIDQNAPSDEHVPLLSVGLPVYNGADYLEQSIASLLAQSFRDFELIICDNASTDATREVCEPFARADNRVHYRRSEEHVGGAKNANRTFSFARGKYFRWAGYDDLTDPHLFERCIEVLEADDRVVLCDSSVLVIDGSGNTIDRLARGFPPDAPKGQLFRFLTTFDHGCDAVYGVMRSSVLARTGLYRDYTDSDRTLLAHMALLGRFYEIPDPLFFRRIHETTSTRVYPDWRGRMVWFGEEYRTKVTLPFWRQLGHYLQIIWTSPLTPADKFGCYSFMVTWVASYRRWRSLMKDVVVAVQRKARELAHSASSG